MASPVRWMRPPRAPTSPRGVHSSSVQACPSGCYNTPRVTADRYPRPFGKYVLLRPLARGGMGEIYLAAGGEIGGFEKLCVIKKVLTEKADPGRTGRFLDEAKVVVRL